MTRYYLPTQKYFPFEKSMVRSIAWRELTATAKDVYLIFWLKVITKNEQIVKRTRNPKRYIENNGKLIFTYKEAREKYGWARSTFSKAIDDLFDRGFIDIARPGISRVRLATLYAISERWKEYGTKHFKKIERKKNIDRGGVEAFHRYHEQKRSSMDQRTFFKPTGTDGDT